MVDTTQRRWVVGRFTLDADGTLTGPAVYLREQGDAKLRAIVEGKDAVFNATAHLSPDPQTAILVHLQTDYAAWHGLHDLMRSFERATPTKG